MKTLVACFSRSGHTGQLAKEVAARCGADLEAIRESRGHDGPRGYWRYAWQALIRAAPLCRAAGDGLTGSAAMSRLPPTPSPPAEPRSISNIEVGAVFDEIADLDALRQALEVDSLERLQRVAREGLRTVPGSGPKLGQEIVQAAGAARALDPGRLDPFCSGP